MLDPSKYKQPLMLDIGAGGFSSDDKFTSVDKFTDSDISADMWSIPLPDESVFAIFSSNALEHVEMRKVVPTLQEWHRLLKPKGKLQLLVPDLEWACQWWLDHQSTGWDMAIIYGHQKHEGEFHKTGFTPKILLNYFEQSNPGGWYIHKAERVDGKQYAVPIENGTKYKITVNQMLINVEAQKI